MLIDFPPNLREKQGFICESLEKLIMNNKLNASLLFTGGSYEQKLDLAKTLFQFLNKNITNNQYVELEIISPEKNKTKLSMQQIKELQETFTVSSNFKRLIVFDNADQTILHKEPANALLKVVEEAPTNVQFIFFADSELNVLNTIKSRCMIFRMLPVFSNTDIISRIKTNLEHPESELFMAEFLGAIEKSFAVSNPLNSFTLQAIQFADKNNKFDRIIIDKLINLKLLLLSLILEFKQGLNLNTETIEFINTHLPNSLLDNYQKLLNLKYPSLSLTNLFVKQCEELEKLRQYIRFSVNKKIILEKIFMS